MKADFQKLSSQSATHSFVDFWVKANSFGFHWHYHPELELCYVKKGRGKRIIGEHMGNFEDGDLVLVGPNLPHSWITDEQFNASEEQIEVYVIQFDKAVFTGFDELPEFSKIRQLMQEADRGVFFKDVESALVDELLQQIDRSTGFNKLLGFLELIGVLGGHYNKVFLCGSSHRLAYKKHQEERILRVCNFIHNNYKNDISITQLADLAAMGKASFCRFFKQTLGKTAMEYIHELRISEVCNLLQHTADPIYKIAYGAGYSSIAHFNKQFRKNLGTTPSAFRRVAGGYVG